MILTLIFVVLTMVTGAGWLAEKFVFGPRRNAAVAAALAEYDARRATLADRYGVTEIDAAREQIEAGARRRPLWLELCAELFPVIVTVFVLRSFVAEPFRIPSGSMEPTLQAGDFVLVNKYAYGLRLPLVNRKLVELGAPQRGDVVVFRYPPNESLDYIKRVVGVPGDVVEYRHKRLTINGEPQAVTAHGDYLAEERMSYLQRFDETLGHVTHSMLNDPQRPDGVWGAADFPYRDQCSYDQAGFRCRVPPGHYFVMGDNRDNSADSRYWGFVPDRNLVGRAYLIWMNLSHPSRIGAFH